MAVKVVPSAHHNNTILFYIFENPYGFGFCLYSITRLLVQYKLLDFGLMTLILDISCSFF